jgi:hypothetical protein
MNTIFPYPNSDPYPHPYKRIVRKPTDMEMTSATWKVLRIMLLMLLLPEFVRQPAITLSSDYQIISIDSQKGMWWWVG